MSSMRKMALISVVIAGAAVLALVFLWPARQEARLPLPSPARLQEGAARALPGRSEVDAPAVRTSVASPGRVHGLRGRVIEARTGSAISGFGIEVEGTSLRAVSDTEGRFFLALEGEEGVTLRVLPTAGWVLAVDRYVVTTEHLQRGDELVVSAKRIPSGSWSFTLVDQATDEPVPAFAILAEAEDGTTAELVSDEEGVVELGERLGGRRLALRCRDHPLLHAQWSSAPPLAVLPPMEGAPRPRLGIPVGPTYRLHVEGVARTELASLRAVLLPREGRRREDERGSHAAPVRTEGDERPWVRFGPFDRPLGPGPPWLLEVSKGPSLSGAVEVQRVRGVHPGVLDVSLEGVGAIRGLARNDDSDAPIVGAVVLLSAIGGEPRSEPDRIVLTAEDGSFHLAALRSGSYSIGLVAEGYAYASATLRVLPGETAEHEFRLSTEVLFGQVSGALTSVTGRYSMPVRLVLTPRDGGVSVYEDVTWEERDDGFIASFTFDEVPHGKYRLRLHPALGHPWEPMTMDVSCPAEGLAFLCRDDIEPVRIHVRAFDASTRQELSETWVFVETRVDGETFQSSELGPVPSGFPVGSILPGRTTLDLVVGAPGFVPLRGDESSLVEVSRPWGPALEAHRHLERGWGILLEVLELQHDGQGPPVAGADVYADGELIGRTGRDGRLLLRRQRAPERIEVKAASSSVAWAEPFDDKGRLRSKFAIRGRVWMH